MSPEKELLRSLWVYVILLGPAPHVYFATDSEFPEVFWQQMAV